MVAARDPDLRSACDADGPRRDAWASGRRGRRAGRYGAGGDDRQASGRGRGGRRDTRPPRWPVGPRGVLVRGAPAAAPRRGSGRGARAIPRGAEPALPAALSVAIAPVVAGP